MRFSNAKYPLKWLLRHLTALNVKLLVEYSGVIRSKTQSKESIQLNETHNVACPELGS